MFEFLYQSLFFVPTGDSVPAPRHLAWQLGLLALVLGLVLAGASDFGGGGLLVVTVLVAAVLAVSVLWLSAWLAVVTATAPRNYYRILAAATWPLLLVGPAAALGRTWPAVTGVVGFGIVVWMGAIALKGLAQVTSQPWYRAFGTFSTAVALGTIAGVAVAGAPLLLVFVLASL